MQIVIDEGFRSQLDPPDPVERSFLEQSILADGCRDKLVVWHEKNILLDGHNRYEICTTHKLPFEVEYLSFETREAAEDWIDKNQAGKRNCSPEQKRILVGRIYNRRKKTKGGQIPGTRVDQIDPPLDSTADEVAAELGVSSGTVKRNAQRAEVYDAMLELGDKEAAEAARKVPQAVISEAKRAGEQAADVLKKPHVSNNSGEQDWYTPPQFIEAARRVLSEIDTDPASSDVAQQFVKAKTYFTAADDGLKQEWRGRVWLNPPYSAGVVEKFAEKLIESLNTGVCSDAIVLVNNATETRWFQLLANHADAVCFPCSRIKFLDSTGAPKQSPLQGQAFLYFGDSSVCFADVFSDFGALFVGGAVKC